MADLNPSSNYMDISRDCRTNQLFWWSVGTTLSRTREIGVRFPVGTQLFFRLLIYFNPILQLVINIKSNLPRGYTFTWEEFSVTAVRWNDSPEIWHSPGTWGIDFDYTVFFGPLLLLDSVLKHFVFRYILHSDIYILWSPSGRTFLHF